MARGMQSAAVLDEQSLRVIQRLSGVQFASFLDLRKKLFPADLPAVEIFIPFQQVLHRSVDRAIAGLLKVRYVQPVARAFFLCIGRRETAYGSSPAAWKYS